MMLALLRANPEAFDSANVNTLKRGQVLRVPKLTEIQTVSQVDALEEVKGRRRVGPHRPARLFRLKEEHPYLLKERGILFPF